MTQTEQRTRNFWTVATPDDGLPLATGPDGDKGGLEIEVSMRQEGKMMPTLLVTGRCDDEGALTLDVRAGDTLIYHERHTA